MSVRSQQHLPQHAERGEERGSALTWPRALRRAAKGAPKDTGMTRWGMRALALFLGVLLVGEAALAQPRDVQIDDDGLQAAPPAVRTAQEDPSAHRQETATLEEPAVAGGEAEEKPDVWTTVVVVSILAGAIVTVATSALLASWRPPCDATLGCSEPP